MLKEVYIGSKWSEEPSKVKKEVLRFYKDRFSSTNDLKIRLDNVLFAQLIVFK